MRYAFGIWFWNTIVGYPMALSSTSSQRCRRLFSWMHPRLGVLAASMGSSIFHVHIVTYARSFGSGLCGARTRVSLWLFRPFSRLSGGTFIHEQVPGSLRGAVH